MENVFFIDVSRFDEIRNKDKLKILKENLKTTNKIEEADYILALGGDGCLLNSIYNYKKYNKPFFGINGGTLGYFMQHLFDKNNKLSSNILKGLKENVFFDLEMPLIDVESESESGEIIKMTAFADTWFERANAQSLKYKICVEANKSTFFSSNKKNISGDGILISSAAGSTGYLRNISSIIMPIGLKTLCVAPKHSTVDKRSLASFILNEESSLHVEFFDTDFRVPKFVIDGKDILSKDGKSFIPKRAKINMSKETIKLAYFEENYLEKKSFDYLMN